LAETMMVKTGQR